VDCVKKPSVVSITTKTKDAEPAPVPEVDYHYSEPEFLKELAEHVRLTNLTHYSGEIQPVDFIMSHATTMDYLVGNVTKYTFRFGKKEGFNKKDLYKACHYLMMMAHFADKKNEKSEG
jgi:hypothetical protein